MSMLRGATKRGRRVLRRLRDAYVSEVCLQNHLCTRTLALEYRMFLKDHFPEVYRNAR